MDKRTRGVLVAVLSVLLSDGASAQLLGGEFRVNTTTTLNQRRPSLAFDASGSFVVVWQSGSSAVLHSIFGQRYSAAGAPLGGEFVLNTYTTLDAGLPAAASNGPGGGFVVVWERFVAPSSSELWARRLDAAGTGIGGEFRVDTATTGYQDYPGVASDAAGNFVVVWQSDDQTAPGSRVVVAQRFSSAGAALGSPFDVSFLGGEYPSVASDAAGNFVVAWQQGLVGGAFAQRFSNAGVGYGSFTVNAAGTYPSVGANSAGDFVITWNGLDGSSSGVFAQRYAPTGAALGASVQINTFTTGFQGSPRVAIEQAGAFAVTWVSGGQDGSLAGVFGRGASSTGVPLGMDVRINTYTTERQNFQAIATDGVGHFVIAWESYGQDGDGWGVYAQRFAFCRPGDVDNSNTVDVADVFYLINYLFASGPAPVCSGDVDASGTVDVADVFYLINYLFAGGPAPQ
jgi:hypothetical protein